MRCGQLTRLRHCQNRVLASATSPSMTCRSTSRPASSSRCSARRAAARRPRCGMIAGFIQPTDGTSRWTDSVLSSSSRAVPPERRNMSMIFQSYAIWPHMTVAENVAFGLTLRQTARRRDRAQGRRGCSTWSRSCAHWRTAIPPSSRAGSSSASRWRARSWSSRSPAARRAAVQPRRQSSRGDALRDPPAARRISHHHGLRHPRPGRGDGHLRPHRRDEPRAHRADRHPLHPV